MEAMELELMFGVPQEKQESAVRPRSRCDRCCIRCPDAPPATQEIDEPSPPETIRRLAAQWKGEAPCVADVWNTPGVGGHTRFVLGGRVVGGPRGVDRMYHIAACTCMIAPTTFYFAICCRFLWIGHRWLVCSTISFVLLTIIFNLLTSFTDPGIIPRPVLQLLVPGLQEEVAEAIGVKGKFGDRPPDLLDMTMSSSVMDLLEQEGFRWCRWCHMIQPPRAKHCKDCNCCVLVEDHHCPFLNTCVGQRNYAFFYGFVISVCSLATTFVMGVSLWLRHVSRDCWYQTGAEHQPVDRQEAVECTTPEVIAAGFAVFLDLAVGLLLLAVFCLASWHLWLITKGMTTREVLTGKVSKNSGRPTLCARRGKSLVRGRDKIVFPDLTQL